MSTALATWTPLGRSSTSSSSTVSFGSTDRGARPPSAGGGRRGDGARLLPRPSAARDPATCLPCADRLRGGGGQAGGRPRSRQRQPDVERAHLAEEGAVLMPGGIAVGHHPPQRALLDRDRG